MRPKNKFRIMTAAVLGLLRFRAMMVGRKYRQKPTMESRSRKTARGPDMVCRGGCVGACMVVLSF